MVAYNTLGNEMLTSGHELRHSLQHLIQTNRGYRTAMDLQAKQLREQKLENNDLKEQMAVLQRNKLLYQEKLRDNMKAVPCHRSHRKKNDILKLKLVRKEQDLNKAKKQVEVYVASLNQDIQLLQRWLQDNMDCTERVNEIQCPWSLQKKNDMPKLELVMKEQVLDKAKKPEEEWVAPLNQDFNLLPRLLQDNTDCTERVNDEVPHPRCLQKKNDMLKLTLAMKEHALDKVKKTVEEHVAFLNQDIQSLQRLLQDNTGRTERVNEVPCEGPAPSTIQEEDKEKNKDSDTNSEKQSARKLAWWERFKMCTSEFSGKVKKILQLTMTE